MSWWPGIKEDLDGFFFLKLSAHIKPVHSKQLIFEGQPFVFIFWDRLAM